MQAHPIPAGSDTKPGLTDSVIAEWVWKQLHVTLFVDMHTHLFMPSMGKLGLWGIDALLTYHYLEAEFFRVSKLTAQEYWNLPKHEQADRVWQELFVRRLPLSSATRDIVTILNTFGLPVECADLSMAREFFASRDLETHVQAVLRAAGISDVVMTNDPLDPEEATCWLRNPTRDIRFHAALRLDRIVTQWEQHWPALQVAGYGVEEDLAGRTLAEVRRFLGDWCRRVNPVYMAVSLPDSFMYPEESIRARLLSGVVLPACREFDLPLALMIGVRRQVNPALRLAGDAVGRANLICLESLCRDFPQNRFLVTVLSRENQHELCVYARKFSNLMPFGCWWFVNQPSIIEEITRERIEMLGTSFIPQHSDARVLEQLIPKWQSTRQTMAPVLTREYSKLAAAGRTVSETDIANDIERLFRGNLAGVSGVIDSFALRSER